MKIKGRMNLFTCFRPLVVENEKAAVEKRKHKEGNAGGMVSRNGAKEITLMSDDQIVKEKQHRSMSRVLKVILFNKSLSKKKGSKKYREGKTSSKRSSESGDITRSSSNGSSLFTSSSVGSSSLSSSASSFASNSRSGSERKSSIDLNQVNNNKNKQVMEDGASGCFSSSDIGFCFLLVCVLVLINWGKVIAIFCTSLCFFFAPRRSKVIHPRANDDEILDIDSEEYKKKVIMEGLLERSRTRSL